MHADSPEATPSFRELLLNESLVQALAEVGYQRPSPIQAATIPHLLAGGDLVGQAHTGTGKTAAFALPILSQLDVAQPIPQALVLVPTRELAVQVAQAFQRYAAHLKGFAALPIYGGQSYTPQLQSLRRGVHVIVGTPGRIMDHIKRDTLQLSAVKHLVLDEADEMLRMGFIEDVEWILQQVPAPRQVALFSATMPEAVRRIAQNHLHKPAEVTIRSSTVSASSIRQRYWAASGVHKLDALTRILEAESFDAVLVFTRTKLAAQELAERLQARGFAAHAVHGDMAQAQRERTIAQLKAGQVDIVIATDVAARGLDVERVSHVVNYDAPYDPQSYIHRIGRTGRAGRSGEAILFIAPRERSLLRVIERVTRQPIQRMELPTIEAVNQQRIARFHERITATLATAAGDSFRALIERYASEHNVPALEIAAALASLAHGSRPLLLQSHGQGATAPGAHTGEPPAGRSGFNKGARPAPERARRQHPSAAEFKQPHAHQIPAQPPGKRAAAAPEDRDSRHRNGQEKLNMETYRIEVGHVHGIQAGHIVGAIANEAGLEGRYIGRVVIRDDHSFVDLPAGMPKEIFRDLRKVRLAGQLLQISRALHTQAARLRGQARRPNAHKRPHKPRQQHLSD